MAQKKETAFRKRVLRDLKKVEKTVIFSIQQLAIRGDPDLILGVNGLMVTLELKDDDGIASRLQLHRAKRVKDANCISYIVRPEDWPMIFRFIVKLSKLGPLTPVFGPN